MKKNLIIFYFFRFLFNIFSPRQPRQRCSASVTESLEASRGVARAGVNSGISVEELTGVEPPKTKSP